jgi:hypothetical protein
MVRPLHQLNRISNAGMVVNMLHSLNLQQTTSSVINTTKTDQAL